MLVDAYFKYSCIHKTGYTSTKGTTKLLEQDFAHIRYPHILVIDNATMFMSQEFQAWCQARVIIHITTRSTLPTTNQWGSWVHGPDIHEINDEVELTTKRSFTRVSDAMPKDPTPTWIFTQWVTEWKAVLYQAGCKRTISGSRDTVHLARGAMKSQQKEQKVESMFPHQYKVGAPCYALYHGPQRDKDSRWVPAIITRVHGSRSVYVRVCPKEPFWHRYIE